MKLPQYSIATILLMTAAAAIASGGLLVFRQYVLEAPAGFNWLWYCLYLLGITIPLWLPIVFVAVAIARRSLTLPMVIVFGIAEATAVGAAYWFNHHVSLFLPLPGDF